METVLTIVAKYCYNESIKIYDFDHFDRLWRNENGTDQWFFDVCIVNADHCVRGRYWSILRAETSKEKRCPRNDEGQ